MTVEHVRRENAKWLLEHECGGSQTVFGERMGWRIRSIASRYLGRNAAPKDIGPKVARKIEQAFGKPVGWLDERHTSMARAPSDTVSIPGLDVGGILGPGRLPMLLDATVRQMEVGKDWLRKNLHGSVSEYLALATVSGDSMGELLPDGSLVLVDRGASAVEREGLYMLGRADPMQPGVWFRHVKRKVDGTYHLSTQNKADQSTHQDLAKAGIIVLGRVVARLELKRV